MTLSMNASYRAASTCRRLLLILLALAGCSSVTAAQRAPSLPRGADANDWEAYFDRAKVLLRTDPGQADALFAYASHLDPRRAEPLYGRWVAFHIADLRRFSDYLEERPEVLESPAVLAADSLELAALSRNPFVHRGLSALLYEALPGRWSDDLATRAFLSYAQGDLQRATNDLAVQVHRTPHDPAALHWLALAQAALGQFDPARESMELMLAELRRRDSRRAGSVYASRELTEYSIGLLQLARGRVPEAREAMSRAVVENAAAWYAHRGLAQALLARGQSTEALVEYRTALELAGEEPLLLFEYGVALRAAGQRDAAREQLRKAVTREPRWADAWLELARAEDVAGHPHEALEAYDAYVARAPLRSADVVTRTRTRIAELRASAGS